MIKGKKIFFLLGILIIFFILFIGGRVPFFLIYIYIGIFCTSFFYIRFGISKIHGEIKLPDSNLMAGDIITIVYVFTNESSLFFPFLEFDSDIVNKLSGQKMNKKSFYLNKKEKYSNKSEIVCNRRGLYKVGEANLKIKDIFNIFSITKKIHEPISIKIYPRIFPINHFDIFGNLQMGDLIVKKPIFQDYSSIADLRKYYEGDSVKKVHWKLSAKTDQLILKEFELKGDSEIVILINNCQEDYIFDLNKKIEDTAVEIAMSIIDFSLENSMKISLASKEGYCDQKIKGNSKAYLKLFLEEMVAFQTFMEGKFIQKLINVTLSINQGGTLVIITPKLSQREGISIINLKIKNINPIVIIVRENLDDEFWETTEEISKKIENEGIPIYIVDVKEHYGKVLEGNDEKRAR